MTAISEVITNPDETCFGTAKNNMGEARLDIIDSEINREFFLVCFVSLILFGSFTSIDIEHLDTYFVFAPCILFSTLVTLSS